jgi:hypothetical protein
MNTAQPTRAHYPFDAHNVYCTTKHEPESTDAEDPNCIVLNCTVLYNTVGVLCIRRFRFVHCAVVLGCLGILLHVLYLWQGTEPECCDASGNLVNKTRWSEER